MGKRVESHISRERSTYERSTHKGATKGGHYWCMLPHQVQACGACGQRSPPGAPCKAVILLCVRGTFCLSPHGPASTCVPLALQGWPIKLASTLRCVQNRSQTFIHINASWSVIHNDLIIRAQAMRSRNGNAVRAGKGVHGFT